MRFFKSYFSLQSFNTYLAQYRWRVIVVFISFVISNGLIALLPLFVGKLVGSLTADPINSSLVWHYAILLILISLFHTITWRISELLYLKLMNPVAYRYENILFNQIIHKPYPYFVDKFTGKISSYITTIAKESRELLEKLFWNYSNSVISLVLTSVILTAINWQTGLLFIAGLVLMLIVGRKTVKNNMKYEQVFTDVQATKNGRIIDAIANFVNVKSFQKENLETETIIQQQNKTIKAANKSFVASIWFWTSMGFIVRELIWPATILINVYLFLHHQITVAEMTTFLTAIVMFTSYVWESVWHVSEFSLKLSRLEEAHTYLFGKINIMQNLDMSKSSSQDYYFVDTLRFKNLHFAYPDNPSVDVLSKIDLTIKKGQKVGIVGKSGSGKTTLTKLLLGYYPIEDNEIILDGESINNLDLTSLISYVPQDTSLFHRSIGENIAYATNKDADLDEVISSAKQAHAHEFIEKIKGGYDALVGERGVKLSAGQRQRIAIARAFIDNNPILILDEATSALDSESEVLVQQALEKLWQNKTVIAIAHRLSTLRNMDKIVVLEKGRIIEEGSHEELLQHKGKYAQLWAHQSGGFLEE